MDLRQEAREAAIEVIATLVDIKSTMTELLLRPSGVPADVYRQLLSRKDELTGKDISKRKFAPLLLDELDRRPGLRADLIIRGLIRIASEWNRFELAHDRYRAMATVERAKEIRTILTGQIEFEDLLEAKLDRLNVFSEPFLSAAGIIGR